MYCRIASGLPANIIPQRDPLPEELIMLIKHLGARHGKHFPVLSKMQNPIVALRQASSATD
jgi:hypothetical protein